MKTGVLFLFGMLMMSGVIVMDSCKKDKVRGCTDPDSINYDALAEKNDGSCQYEGYAVIWYNQSASEGLVKDGASALTFYLNGEVVGSSAATVYWTSAPDCGANGSVSVTQSLGRNKTGSFNLTVKDQTNFEYWNTTLNMEANTCLALELQWTTSKKK
jgi:hypothetical protein